MPQEQEIVLVRKAKDGDTAAFGEIVRRYQDLVYATAFQVLKDASSPCKAFGRKAPSPHG